MTRLVRVIQEISGYRGQAAVLCIQGDNIVLLHAYKKQSQKAPKKEIETAEKRMMEVFDNESTYTD